MNWRIHGSVLTASLLVSCWSYAQVAPAASKPLPIIDQPDKPQAPAADAPAAKPDAPAPTPQQQKIADLIAQLGADDFAKRDQASEELQKLGTEALPALREALKHDDPSIRSYAEYLVTKIEGKKNPRFAANQRWTAVNNPRQVPDGGALLLNRPGRFAINVAGVEGVRISRIDDGQRQIKIEEGPEKIRMTVTEGNDTKEYEAKSIEELRKEQPEAAKIYDQYSARGRALVAPRAIRLAPGAEMFEVKVGEQIQEVQRRQDRLIQEQQLRIRDFLDAQLQDDQFDIVHKRLKAETEMLERRLAEVEAMHKRLLEQTQAAQKRLAELEKQQRKQEVPK